MRKDEKFSDWEAEPGASVGRVMKRGIELITDAIDCHFDKPGEIPNSF